MADEQVGQIVDLLRGWATALETCRTGTESMSPETEAAVGLVSDQFSRFVHLETFMHLLPHLERFSALRSPAEGAAALRALAEEIEADPGSQSAAASDSAKALRALLASVLEPRTP